MKKHAIEQEATTSLPAADPVISGGSQLPLSNRYLDMLVKVDQTPFIHNFLAGLFTWLLLAGYIVFPGAFTSISNANALNKLGNVGKTVLTAVQKSLLSVAAICCIFSAFGMGWLWRKFCANFIWLEYHLFLPGLRYSVVGLINSLVSIYTAHDGFWSVAAIVTTIVTATCSIVMLALYLVYEKHHQEARTEFEQEMVQRTEQVD